MYLFLRNLLNDNINNNFDVMVCKNKLRLKVVLLKKYQICNFLNWIKICSSCLLCHISNSYGIEDVISLINKITNLTYTLSITCLNEKFFFVAMYRWLRKYICLERISLHRFTWFSQEKNDEVESRNAAFPLQTLSTMDIKFLCTLPGCWFISCPISFRGPLVSVYKTNCVSFLVIQNLFSRLLANIFKYSSGFSLWEFATQQIIRQFTVT